jgi:uncharacterized protein
MTDIHSDIEAAERHLASYREARGRAVRQPQGVLALVNTQWITGEAGVRQPIWGVPGLWAPREPGESGLILTAELADDISVDGRLAQGQVIVRGRDDDNPSEIRFSDTVTGYVIAGEDGGYAVRVWDAESEAIREFGRIDAYPYNPEWVVRASFTPLTEVRAVGFEHVQDDGRTRERVIPADIAFEKDGVRYTLAAYWDEHKLLLVFGDATNGESTYGVGRFLKVLPNDDGTITLDFNRAYLPPCAFSYHFNCPIPPKQNRFAVAIEAGEKNVLNRSGGLLH